MKSVRKPYAPLRLFLTVFLLCALTGQPVRALTAQTTRLSYIVGGAHARALVIPGENTLYTPAGSLPRAEQAVKTILERGNADTLLLALQVTDLLAVVNPPSMEILRPALSGQALSLKRWTDCLTRLKTLWTPFAVPDGPPALLSDPPVRIDDYVTLLGEDSFRPVRPSGTYTINYWALSAVGRIKTLCDTAGIPLTVGLMPAFDGFTRTIDSSLLLAVWTQLARQTDYWNVSGYHALTADPRLFSNRHQYNETMGAILAGLLFDRADAYRPKGLGVWTTKDNVASQESLARFPGDLSGYASQPSAQAEVAVPILMYHQLSPDPALTNAICMTPERFGEHMTALSGAGYTPVFITDLIAYVHQGAPLPVKPIAITFDDGYEGNFVYAYPILRELGLRATINMIGWSAGLSHDPSAEQAITPHFSWEQGAQMAGSGFIDLQSHSFNLHTRSDIHTGARPFSDESFRDYADRLAGDHEAFTRAMRNRLGVTPTVFCYPYGAGHPLSEVILRDLGYQATLTTIPEINRIRPGQPYSLYGLGRFNVPGDMTGAQLVDMLRT